MERSIRRAAMPLALATAALLAGCHKGPPEGQVVARVNGEEITQNQLNAEMAALGVPPAARSKAQPAVLQQIVERTLLTQAAKKDGVDKDPEYVTLRQRDDDLLLAQRYVRRRTQDLQKQPSDDQVGDFLDSHPAMTSQRQLLSLDQLQFPAPTNAEQLRALQGTQTMDQLVGVLQSQGIKFQRAPVKADTAVIPDDMMAKLNQLKPGEPLIVLGGPVLTAAVITAREPVPANAPDATAIAKQRLVSDAMGTRLKQEETALRQGAKIEYARGMAPPAPQTAGTPKP